MTEELFIKYNNIFNKFITQDELDEDYRLIDNESILSRVHKKLGSKIDNDLLGIILMFNVAIKDENYKLAQEWKDYILTNYNNIII